MRTDLIQAAQGGDVDAFGSLATEAHDRLYAVARRILRDPDAAQDAVQECLVKAWQRLRGLRELERFDAWLYRLLVNACRDEGRRRRIRSIEGHVLSLDPPVADGTVELEERDQIERAFRRLTVEQRAVLVLHHYLGLHLPEIAATLGIREGTARSRLHYATLAMRAVLEADLRPGFVAEGGRTA
jgi:RNA polymerase sigma-70 factor (ECF subfamily)